MIKPAHLFERIESLFFYGLGAMLAVAALVAFLEALYLLAVDILRGAGAQGIVIVLDRVLLVLMLIELLYTVRISVQSREIQCQPFLIIGLIAAIRRVLVVTLQTSMLTPTKATPLSGGVTQGAGEHGILASSSGELLILSLLIATMVGAIAVLKRAKVP